jgi:hypothetical protein
MITVITAEVGADDGSRRLAKISPVVPEPPLGDESLPKISDNERFVDDDVMTSCEVSRAVSCGGGFVIVVLWNSAEGRFIARGK